MKWYRVTLYSDSGGFQGKNEYEAEDDVAAMAIAEHIYDACSDVCESFELWDGLRRVDTSFSKMPRPVTSIEHITAMRQRELARSEEALKNSHWAVARSRRLIERMNHLMAERG